MPGQLVKDSSGPVLLNATTTTTTTTTGVLVGRPARVRVRLTTGTVTSTGNTATLGVEVQGSDSSTFASGVVSYGQFAAKATTDALSSNLTRYLLADVQHAYMRVIATVGGTSPSWGSLRVDVQEVKFERTKTDSA